MEFKITLIFSILLIFLLCTTYEFVSCEKSAGIIQGLDDSFFNIGQRKKLKNTNSKLENSILKSKVDVLGDVLKKHVNTLRDTGNKQVDLIFLVDSSASVGAENFASEIRFVQKLLSDFTVAQDATRVAVVTFSSKDQVVRHVDHISKPAPNNHKCGLLLQELPKIKYSGGGTYTLGAVLEAQTVLAEARPTARRAVFLITDGFSNGGDPIPAAQQLKEAGTLVFTFGIRNGNTQELYEMASQPGEEYSYILDSFGEFSALVRRALHQDLKAGYYQPLDNTSLCDELCSSKRDCCDVMAECSCGIDTGHYSCLCPPGFYGSGLAGTCQVCPNGTFSDGSVPGDESICSPCPDANHITFAPATSHEDCCCKEGFTVQGDTCQVITCPKLSPPSKGFFVKKTCANVLNAACGVRCRVGYQLVGSSIRLCQENGTWSGEETECIVKTCPSLKAPENGRMTCSSKDYVIDTECEFSCHDGYHLVGSRLRSCLPLAQWDGLQTSCKPVQCHPLPALTNGVIVPSNCTTAKQGHGTQCSMSCSRGYQLRGPKIRTCGGRVGTWSGRNMHNRCVDVTPPTIRCPENIVISTDLNEDYATVNWTAPTVDDNSAVPPAVWSKPALRQPAEMKLGKTRVVFIAADGSRNRARCNITITVEDHESPVVDSCESPPTFLSDSDNAILTWDAPQFRDNSGKPLQVMRTPDTDVFRYGTTQVTYVATDAAGNNNTCTINITVEENTCHEPPDPINGHANCTSHPEALHCVLTCQEGYAFAVPPRDYFCTYDEAGTVLAPDNEIDPSPDCSVTVLPNTIIQDGVMVLEGDDTICLDTAFLSQLESDIRLKISEQLAEACGNELSCDVSNIASICDQILSAIEEESNAVSRRRREVSNKQVSYNHSAKQFTLTSATPSDTEIQNINHTLYIAEPTEATIQKPSNRIEVHFQMIGRTKKNHGNPAALEGGMRRAKESLHKASRKGSDLLGGQRRKRLKLRTVNLKSKARLLCEDGSILKGGLCVKCPIGTYFNKTLNSCEFCAVGEYQNVTGKFACIPCPAGTSTGRIHAKSLRECRPLCPAGYFGHKRRPHLELPGVKPCSTCAVGSYQTHSGQTQCLPCPDNTSTVRRGSKSAEDCIGTCPAGSVSLSGMLPCLPCPEGFLQPASGKTSCFNLLSNEILTPNECFSLPCLNGGSCNLMGEQYFSCDCPAGFVGSLCEVTVHQCDSSPCLHGGSCVEKDAGYGCICPPGYSGENCEVDIDECASSPCQNNGLCLDSVNSFICLCEYGFEGLTCETNIDDCYPLYCLNGATCIDGVGNYSCQCPEGVKGQHCELEPQDPCDEEPCLNDAVCHSTESQYSCTCLVGYTGQHCEVNIDDCAHNPCQNNGTCIDQVGRYNCSCPPTFSGKQCETSLPREFFLHFPTSGTTDYVVMKRPFNSLNQVTMCVWLQSTDHFNYGTVFSYASRTHDNSFTLADYNGFVLYVNGERVVTDIMANDGRWHHTCVTWTSEGGTWTIYIDGELGDSGNGLASGSDIPENGTLVLGQEQDKVGGAFSEAESFMGQLSGVAVWDKVLEPQQIWDLATLCSVGNVDTILSWTQFLGGIRGNLQIENSTFCRECDPPSLVINGEVDVIKVPDKQKAVFAVYYCNDGYVLRSSDGQEARAMRRRCLKQGQWEGDAPICVRLSCGFPGYFPRGLIIGRSYRYADMLRYRCLGQYKLIGEAIRMCLATGQWSGVTPVCQGRSCPVITPPALGRVQSLAEDDLSPVPYAGHQVAVECLSGSHLIGASVLTCQEDGQWDEQVPYCQPVTCPAPPQISNGFYELRSHVNLTEPVSNFTHTTSTARAGNSTTDQLFDSNTTLVYQFGDVLHYKCNLGSLLKTVAQGTTSQLKCAESGNWEGVVPSCVPIECPVPPFLENGVIQVKTEVPNSATEGIEMAESGRQSFPTQAGSFLYGTEIELVCDQGFELIGPKLRHCLESGTWSSMIMFCNPVTCDTSQLPFYTDATVQSSNGTATPTLNGLFEIQGNSYGDIAVFKCKEGFDIVKGLYTSGDQIMWTCHLDSMWHLQNGSDDFTALLSKSKAQLCLPPNIDCPPPKTPENAYLTTPLPSSTHTYKFGSQVSYKCRQGYQLNGVAESVCETNGQWSNETSCKPVQCRQPPTPPNTELATPSSTFVYGNMVLHLCKEGYEAYGDLTSRCQASGRWSRVRGKCSKVSCGKPVVGGGATVLGRSYLYQDQVVYSCPQGTKASSHHVLTCQSNGKWSDSPTCKPI